ncbi:MAG TPA: hypothetical protein VIH89_11455 [Candidatus Sulfotelmatobacter sp.]|jgi:hypothetical protein
MHKVLACTLSLFALAVSASASNRPVTELAGLNGTDNQSGSGFGNVAISQDGNTVAVGAAQGDGTAGEIYVYQKPSAGWVYMNQTARLMPTDQCLLGGALAISADGGTIASFAGNCAGGGFTGIGSIEVFIRPAAGWQDTTHPDATLALINTGAYNNLGLYLGMSADGKTIVSTGYFAYPKKSYLFVFDQASGGWTNMGPSNSVLLSNLAVGPEAVAINGETIAVTDQPNKAVLVFQRSTGGIQKIATLTASDGDRFSIALAMDSQSIIADGYASDNKTGKVYLFSKPASGWANATETAQFPAPDDITFLFGIAIAKSGKELLLGGEDNSAAFLYVEPAGGWQTTFQPKFAFHPEFNQGNFGDSVAMTGATVVVGNETAGTADLFTLQ